jgi:hypothetical protein
MSDIVQFNQKSQPQPEKPKSPYQDEWLLKWCAEWRVARAQQLRNWAEHEAATMWGTLPDKGIHLDTKPLHQMKELESLISEMKPETLHCAREMLGVVITILAYEDPKGTLAEGPLLDIVRNVVNALEEIDGTIVLKYRPKRIRKRHKQAALAATV